MLYRETYSKPKKHGKAVKYTYVTLRNSILVGLSDTFCIIKNVLLCFN